MSVMKITQATFDADVMKSDKPVLIDFWAPWCGPCKMLGPVIEEVSREAGEGVKIGKVNVDEEPELASAFGVSSIPTLVIMKNGKPVHSAVGLRSKSEIASMIREA